jgi:hypothetical protein
MSAGSNPIFFQPIRWSCMHKCILLLVFRFLCLPPSSSDLDEKRKKKCSLSVSNCPLWPVEHGAVFSTSLWLRCCVHTYRESVFFGTKKICENNNNKNRPRTYCLFQTKKVRLLSSVIRCRIYETKFWTKAFRTKVFQTKTIRTKRLGQKYIRQKCFGQ